MLLLTSGIRAYEQLGLRAFGHPGKILAAVIITLHNIGGKLFVFVFFLISFMQMQARGITFREPTTDLLLLRTQVFLIELEES